MIHARMPIGLGLLLGCHFQLNLCDGLCGVESLGARTRAIENGMTPIQAHLVLQSFFPLCAICISRISNPAICLHKGGRSEICILIPPIRGARRRTTCAEDTFVHAVQFLSVFRRLMEFFLWWVIVLKPRLYRLVLLVEEGHIGNEVLDNIHVWKRIDLAIRAWITVNPAQASQRVLPINVHCARAANTLSARTTESKGRIHLVLDLDQSVKDHRACLVEVNLI